MTTRSRLETEIAARLARLSGEGMQRVAEDYARIRYPERFPRFDFRAFSVEGKSRSGWPDAWVDAGGRVDGVEATCAKDKSAVEKHLEEYLTRAREREPRLGGFIHLSGHPAVQLTQAEVTAWRQSFIDHAGIDPDRLELVFGGGLVEVLARPEFARTRIEILGLSDAPRHFKLVRAKRGPDESRLNSAFVPTDEDYAAGRVHRTEAADRVLERLRRDGCALVRGVGASGKSVLAWLLALEFTERRCPAYSLDVADYAEGSPDIGNALIEDLHRFGHPQVLFVVDNCHLDESLAKEVVLAWQELMPSQQPRLLLLGRELRTSRGSLIDSLGIDPLALKARQRELLGVYRRLAWRHSGNKPPPEPPPDVLDDWVSKFGGDPHSPDTTTDLIAFSAAVLRRMSALLERCWTLDVGDAVNEVRAIYLHPDRLSAGEALNLMRLCVMEELELALGEEALADRRAGLDRCYRHYGLVFRQTVGISEQFVRYRLAHAALGELILCAADEPVDRAAERRIVALQHPFGGARAVRRLVAIGRLPEARRLASEMLQNPEFLLNLGSLFYTHMTLRTMQTLGISLPPTLGDTLITGSARNQLVGRALQTPLHSLANFLDYAARTPVLMPIFMALAEDLALPENREPLTMRALQAPLHLLANFLGYAARTPVLKPIFMALTEDLTLPENCRELTISMARQPMDNLIGILMSEIAGDLWNAVFAGIDAGDWDEARRAEEQPKLDAFVTFQRIAYERGRPGLSEAPALCIIRGSTREGWHQPGIGLHHLSHVLRLGRRASPEDKACFLDRVATPDWLDASFESVQTGPLAGNLFGLATALEPNLRKPFQRAALEKRVERELSWMHDAESRASALALLGAASAIGVTSAIKDVDWPSPKELAEVLESRAPIPDRTTIGPLQVQLWLGLREMASMRADPVSVPPHLANRILDLWEATQEGETGDVLSPHVRDSNAAMTAWLRQCKAVKWRLVPPQETPAASGHLGRQ